MSIASTLRSSALGKTYAQKLVLLSALVLLIGGASLAVGPTAISISDVVAGLFGRSDEITNAIVTELRLPRLFLSVSVGAILGCSGAALQGYLRNPLAEPALLGVSNAAALGAVLALYFGAASAFALALPLMASLFALIATVLLLLLANVTSGTLMLILCGIALGSVAGALTSLFLNLSPNPFAAMEITYWLLGSLEDKSMNHVLLALPMIFFGLVLIVWDRRALDALSLGEETAQSLGFDLKTIRLRLICGVAIGVGAAVAVSGSIGFIGLVVPHIIRLWIGHEPSKLLVPSALLGAAILTGADVLVRIIPSTNELKLGVVTSLIGAPFLVHLILHVRARLT